MYSSVQLDVAIDGADEVDPQLCLIKGGGYVELFYQPLILCAKLVVIVCLMALVSTTVLNFTVRSKLILCR